VELKRDDGEVTLFERSFSMDRHRAESLYVPARVDPRSFASLKARWKARLYPLRLEPGRVSCRTRSRRFGNEWEAVAIGNRETWSNSITLGFGKLTYNNFKAPSPIVGPQIMVTAVKRPRHRRSRTKRKWTVRVCVVR
jgi:hypothetical protein